MQPAAGLTDVFRQPRLKRRMHVLVVERDLPFTFGETLFERAQTNTDRVAIIVGNEFLGGQHFRVSYRTTNVVGDESRIKKVVFARRVAENSFIQRQAFFPESAHVSSPCSSGVRALISSTTSVPVPSFVNTSSRILSGNLYEMTCTRCTPFSMAASIAAAFGSMPSARMPFFWSSFRCLRSI